MVLVEKSARPHVLISVFDVAAWFLPFDVCATSNKFAIVVWFFQIFWHAIFFFFPNDGTNVACTNTNSRFNSSFCKIHQLVLFKCFNFFFFCYIRSQNRLLCHSVFPEPCQTLWTWFQHQHLSCIMPWKDTGCELLVCPCLSSGLPVKRCLR